MKTVVSQMALFNKLKDGIIVMPLDYKLSIRPKEYHKYALLISVEEKHLIDSNIKPDFWCLCLQISSRDSQSDETHEKQSFCLIQCQSIELNELMSSQTVTVILELSESQYRSLPLLINVSLNFQIPDKLIKYIYEWSDLSETQTLFDMQLTEWTLNEFDFLSFVRCIDQCFDFKELLHKDLNAMNRLEGLASDHQSETQLHTNTIFVFIQTLKEKINIESNDDICSQFLKHLIPKQIPDQCIAVSNRSASVFAFYFGHNVKLMSSICSAQPNFVNMTIESQNISVITSIRKALIETLNVSFQTSQLV
jgi:uncharacterized protein YjaG (DUF416 family)